MTNSKTKFKTEQKLDKKQEVIAQIDKIMKENNLGFLAKPFIRDDGGIGAVLQIVDLEKKKDD